MCRRQSWFFSSGNIYRITIRMLELQFSMPHCPYRGSGKMARIDMALCDFINFRQSRLPAHFLFFTMRSSVMPSRAKPSIAPAFT